VISDLVSSVFVNIALLTWFVLALVIWRIARGNYRRRRIGIVMLVIVWLVQTRPFAERIIAPLENVYATPSLESLQQRNVFDVVVLTGGGYPVEGKMLTSGLPHASMFRFVAGLEICRQIGPRCRITFSGTSGALEQLPTAQVMENLARELASDLTVQSESNSNSTREHPANVQKLIGQNSFVLVTSAYHMPRAMFSFRRAGLNPIPYPVDHYALGNYEWLDLIPSIGNLETIQLALHEYFGFVWYSISVSR